MIESQLKRALLALCVAGLGLAGAAPAAAQDTDYTAEPAAADDGGPAPLEPASAGDAGGSREPLIDGSTVDVNDGLWVGGGFNLIVNSGSDVGFRAEVGLPIVDLPVGRLSVYLPFVVSGERYTGGRSQYFIIDPGVRYEVSLLERYGRLSIFGDFGFGVWIFHNNDDFFGSSSTTYASLRFATGATFTFPFGLFLTLQPVGVVAAMGHNNSGAGYYEYMMLAGYRF